MHNDIHDHSRKFTIRILGDIFSKKRKKYKNLKNHLMCSEILDFKRILEIQCCLLFF